MENKKTEKFALLNLIRALSGNSEQTDGLKEQEEIAPDGAVNTTAATNTPKGDEQGNVQGSVQSNVLIEVIERHEKISNRIRSKKG